MQRQMEMEEVVYNDCYGGFKLSEDAEKEIIRRKFEPILEKCKLPYLLKKKIMVYLYDMAQYYLDVYYNRSDPHLISIVKEMGEKVNANNATKLKIKTVPKGYWSIHEYDGLESVIVERDKIKYDKLKRMINELIHVLKNNNLNLSNDILKKIGEIDNFEY